MYHIINAITCQISSYTIRCCVTYTIFAAMYDVKHSSMSQLDDKEQKRFVKLA
jgi:hypothetical protein